MEKVIAKNNIDTDHDLTQLHFCNLLNRKFGGKTFNTLEGKIKPFNLQDIEGYIRRGNLPKKLGAMKIEKLQISNNISFVRVEDIQKIIELPDFEKEDDLID